MVGGTPCAWPEDFEVNPRRLGEVLLAMTDGAPGGDGYPDSRIFQISKTTSAVNGTQQSGGLYKIIEDSAPPTRILSVQHPSEDCIFDQTIEPASALLNRPIELLDLTGQVFTQNRTVPRGSNWPSNIAGNGNGPLRPCVIAIQRKDSEDRFV